MQCEPAQWLFDREHVLPKFPDEQTRGGSAAALRAVSQPTVSYGIAQAAAPAIVAVELTSAALAAPTTTTPWTMLLQLPWVAQQRYAAALGEDSFAGSNFWLFALTAVVMAISLASLAARGSVPIHRAMRVCAPSTAHAAPPR